MGLITVNIPIVGEANSTEDPKIADALSKLTTEINGELDDANFADDADLNGSKFADGTITGSKIAPGADIDGSTLEDGTVASAKLDLTSDSAVLASDADPVLTGTETSQLETGNMAAGTYLAQASGSVKVTEAKRVVLRLKGVGFELNRAYAFVNDGILSDNEIPFALHWFGDFAGGFPFQVTVQLTGGGVCSLLAGTRLTAVRLG